MAFTQFTYDMDIIAKLSDSPNVDDGLTADQLKAKFDEGGKAVKSYINNVLLVEALERPKFSGMVRSNGRGFVEAVAGTDYQPPILDGDIVLSMLAADVISKLVSSAVIVELAADKWEENRQTVDVAGVKADNPLVVSAAPASHIAYCEAQIRATAQAEGKVTFTCEDVPYAAVSAVVMIVG